MLSEIARVEILMTAGPILMFLFVLELVRRRQLREDYSLLWLATFGVLALLSLFRDSFLYQVANLMGIAYPPAALFVIGFGLTLLVLIQFSLVITRLSTQNKQAAQHIALLGARVRELERRLETQEQK